MRDRFLAAFLLLAMAGCQAAQHVPADELAEQAHQALEQEDYAKALHLYQRAAEEGDGNAQLALAGYYSIGSFKPLPHTGLGLIEQRWHKSERKAAYWADRARQTFRQQGDAGDAEAMLKLYFLYSSTGRLPGQNDVKATQWLLRAAETGNATAMQLKGWYYQHRGRYKEAQTTFARMCSLGFPQGYLALADMHLYGRGMPVSVQDYYATLVEGARAGVPRLPEKVRETVAVLRREAASGNAAAQEHLEVLDGMGVLQSLDTL